MKRCGNCGVEKPRSEFWKMAAAKDGLQTHCKPCIQEKLAVRRRNPDVRAAGKAQILAYAEAERRLREAHRDEFDRYYREERSRRNLPAPKPNHRIDTR